MCSSSAHILDEYVILKMGFYFLMDLRIRNKILHGISRKHSWSKKALLCIHPISMLGIVSPFLRWTFELAKIHVISLYIKM